MYYYYGNILMCVCTYIYIYIYIYYYYYKKKIDSVFCVSCHTSLTRDLFYLQNFNNKKRWFHAQAWLAKMQRKIQNVQIKTWWIDLLVHLKILEYLHLSFNKWYIGLVTVWFFRYRGQIDSFKTVPVSEPILMKIKNYQLIIWLAI